MAVLITRIFFFKFQVYGGFCKEKKAGGGGRKKDAEEAGKTMADMYLLAPESKIYYLHFILNEF